MSLKESKPWLLEGLTRGQWYIKKREIKKKMSISFGCVVCCKKATSKGMCKKHYNRYYQSYLTKNRIVVDL